MQWERAFSRDRRRSRGGRPVLRSVLATLCAAVALLTPAAGFAATTGRIVGTVEDNHGSPLPGATVTITSEALIGGPQTASAASS